ncbi:MAG: hypothetical protein QNJ62_11215, partial [Methyloceanibacter sp.]|nr:hypothetical protein [Methyloceanibacter sp.]
MLDIVLGGKGMRNTRKGRGPSLRTRRRAQGKRGQTAVLSRPQIALHVVPDRKALLLSTALASVAMFVPVAAPTPAAAQVTCPPGTFPPPGPISILTPAGSIDCV